MSKLIHVAGRPYRRRQRCRSCGYILHDWGAKTDWPPEGHDHYWKAGDQVVVWLSPPGYRTSYRRKNAPKEFMRDAVPCGSNQDRDPASEPEAS